MTLAQFNRRARPALLQQLATQNWDLLVIGGGITGASIFRDAALRGLRVVLVEARDFASATSGRSSKLIHGGLRYLKNLGFLLAWESCHERNLHMKLNQRLVRPVPFLMPIYCDRGDSRAKLRLGMWLYELTSGFKNHQFHRYLTRTETLDLAPGLNAQGLTGAYVYYDAMVSDNRWTIETVKDGIRHGGVALNYAPVTSLFKDGTRIAGAVIEDRHGTTKCSIRARAIVNATGIFADTIRRMDRPDALRTVRLSKGTHLVFNEVDVPLNVTTVFNSPLDQRPLFLIKRDGCFLYGTSDDWSDADPSAPEPGVNECGYLLESLRRFMPEAQLNAEKVQFVYSGFRPLLVKGDESANPAKASREDQLEVAPSGLISVEGGKLTTARLMALRALKLVLKKMGHDTQWRPSRTHLLSIGGTNDDVAEALAESVKKAPRLAGYFRVLFERYGLDAVGICDEARRIQRGENSDPRAEPLRAEVQYVCRNEMVCTLEDLFDRRAGFLYWNPKKRLERLRHGAHVIREELSLTEDEFESQHEQYRQHLARFHTLPRL